MMKLLGKIRLKLDNIGLLKLKDEEYIKLAFKVMMGEDLELENPKSFNEKLQWLKLYDRKPEYTGMVDKDVAKKMVAEKIGEKYVIPTYGVFDGFDEIDFGKLPEKFVIKCTHDSGTVFACDNKDKFDFGSARKAIKRALGRNFYKQFREWPYKNVKPRVIVEKYMGKDLNDYKFFCFNGEPKYVLVCSNRETTFEKTWFDMDFKWVDISEGGHPVKPDLKKPEGFAEMKKMAKILAEGTPFTRIDFYDVAGKVYFGEITFYPNGGYEHFEPREWDEKLGRMITLPRRGNEK